MSFVTSASSSRASARALAETLPISAVSATITPTITFILPPPTTTSTTSTSISVTVTAVFSSNFISSNFVSTTTATSQPNSAETSTAAALKETTSLTRTGTIVGLILGGLTLIAIIIVLIIAIILVRRKKKRQSQYFGASGTERNTSRQRPSPIYIQPRELAPQRQPPATATSTQALVSPIMAVAGPSPGDRQQLRRQVSGPMYHRALREQAALERQQAQYQRSREAGGSMVQIERLPSHESEEAIGIARGGESESERGAVHGSGMDSEEDRFSFQQQRQHRHGYGGGDEIDVDTRWEATPRPSPAFRPAQSRAMHESEMEPVDRRASSGIWPGIGLIESYRGRADDYSDREYANRI